MIHYTMTTAFGRLPTLHVLLFGEHSGKWSIYGLGLSVKYVIRGAERRHCEDGWGQQGLSPKRNGIPHVFTSSLTTSKLDQHETI